MRIIALIPARSGSKRIPGKNIKPLNGKPLLLYSIDAAKKCKLIDEIVVSTNSMAYGIYAKNTGAIFFKRPNSVSRDDSTDYDVIRNFIDYYSNTKPDIIAYIRPTTPFRDPKLIDKAIQFMIENGVKKNNVTGLRSVEKMPESAEKCFYINNEMLLEPFAKYGRCSFKVDTDRPDQLCTPTYRGNGYVDIALYDTIISGKLWGDRVYPFETDPVIELDTPFQWKIAEAIGK